MARHPDWTRLLALMPSVREFQALATKHGIDDVFQDNGGKILQMLLALNLQGILGREGNDAIDVHGNEYELKSVNIWLTAGFSTNHHVNIPIIEKYRNVFWVFAIYEGIEMRRVYSVSAAKLEQPYFLAWEEKWRRSNKDINNPHIHLLFVMENGESLYSDDLPLDLAQAARIRAKRKKEAKNRKALKFAAIEELCVSLTKDRNAKKLPVRKPK